MHEGKRCAETLFFDYHRQHNLEIKVARIFNTYGPRMHPDDGRVVSNFIMQAINNQPLTIYGTGEQTRSFCYIDDMLDGILCLMSSPSDFTGPVNLGNQTELSMNELANTILRLTASTSEIQYRQLPSDDPVHRRPNTSLAEGQLSWVPGISLEEGLAHTIRYFQDITQH